jgi:hypothetical protein
MELLVVFTASSVARRWAICSRVRSGSPPTSASSQAACGSSGERLRPPAGLRSTCPVSSTCFTQRTAVAGLTRTWRPASRREAPASNCETINARTSSEYGLRPDIPNLPCKRLRDSHPTASRNPFHNHIRFITAGNCSRSRRRPGNADRATGLRPRRRFREGRRKPDRRRSLRPGPASAAPDLHMRGVEPSFLPSISGRPASVERSSITRLS